MSGPSRILLVESDAKVALSLATAFRQQGWEVVAASDAAMAMAVALKTRPDAVVINTEIPGGGGLTALKRLRTSIHTAATPVIVVGQHATTQKQEFLSAGAQECIEPPSHAAALCAAIQKHLARPQTVFEAPREALRDATRMAALKASGLLDSAPEQSFDRVTQLAAKLLGVPVALLSLVDKDRQFFKSQVGLSEPWATARQTPLSHSFCQWVVSGRESIAIEDANAHPLLRTNLAIRDLGVIAYAGVPVYGKEGQALGSLCAIDTMPRAWTDVDLATLHDLRKLAEACAAQFELAQQPPTKVSDFDRYVEATGNAISGALGILRRGGPMLSPSESNTLFDVIEQHGQHLVQLNRLIQLREH